MLSKLTAAAVLVALFSPSAMACRLAPPSPSQFASWPAAPRSDQLKVDEVALEVTFAETVPETQIVDGATVIVLSCQRPDLLARVTKVIVGDSLDTKFVILPKDYAYGGNFGDAVIPVGELNRPTYVVGRLVASDYRHESDPDRKIMRLELRMAPE